MAIGDPDTRPEEETVFVPNFFVLNRDARDWENTALVPWAIHLPQGAGAREIEDLLLDQLHLQRGDVAVTVHQPEPFLVCFANNAQCATARDLGRFQGNDIDICLCPWRSLTHALGVRIFYRVRLYLDGIPDHAWTPNIFERVGARTTRSSADAATTHATTSSSRGRTTARTTTTTTKTTSIRAMGGAA
jgi:hypothetical protein